MQRRASLDPKKFGVKRNFCKVTRKAYLAYAYRVIRVRGQVSLDLKNFGVRRNFSIFIWLFH